MWTVFARFQAVDFVYTEPVNLSQISIYFNVKSLLKTILIFVNYGVRLVTLVNRPEYPPGRNTQMNRPGSQHNGTPGDFITSNYTVSVSKLYFFMVIDLGERAGYGIPL
jgi:hypothetical protein